MNASFSRVIRDLFDLCELQLQLLAVDSQVAKRKLIFGVACAATALALAVSTLTVLIAGFGLMLHEWQGMGIGTAMVAVAGSGVFVVAGLLAVGLRAVHAAGAAMNESKSEFTENVRWLKATVLSHPSDPPGCASLPGSDCNEPFFEAEHHRPARWDPKSPNTESRFNSRPVSSFKNQR